MDELNDEELMGEVVDELDDEKVMDKVVDELYDEELMDEVVDELYDGELMDEVVDKLLFEHNIFCGLLTSSFRGLFLVIYPLKCIYIAISFKMLYSMLYNNTSQCNLIYTSCAEWFWPHNIDEH